LKTRVDGFSVLLGLLVGDGSHWSKLMSGSKGKKRLESWTGSFAFYSLPERDSKKFSFATSHYHKCPDIQTPVSMNHFQKKVSYKSELYS
jgi:hypothetical protein